MATQAEIATFKAANREIVEKGKPLYAKLESELRKKYPPSHIVIINIDTGEYVIGETEIDALKNAKQTFPSPARGYVCRVDAAPLVEFGGCPQ